MNLILVNRFEQQLASHQLTLRRSTLQTLQINVGSKCNQACRHCHVDAAPWRTEMMDEPTAERIGKWILRHHPQIVDITGGAPELSEFFCYLVETSRKAGCHVIDRNNLTIIEEPGFEFLPAFLAEHEVEVIASLPCYSAENVNKQRGNGVFEKSIRALGKLNAVGYGRELPLNLVYNPPAPYWLPALGEAVGGQRFNAEGIPDVVSTSELLQLKASILDGGANDFYGRWARWFFADRGRRTISAFSPIAGAVAHKTQTSVPGERDN